LGLVRDWRPAAAIPKWGSCSTQNLLALRCQLGFLISRCALKTVFWGWREIKKPDSARNQVLGWRRERIMNHNH
jgi:hypothetical protein